MNCPHCNALLDAHTGITSDDHQPAIGDISVCAYCRGLAVVGTDLKFKVPSIEEMMVIKSGPNWPIIEKARAALSNFKVKNQSPCK